MNLAQCIPAEFVWEGFKERHAPVRRSGLLPPMGLVQRNSNELDTIEPLSVRTNRIALAEARALAQHRATRSAARPAPKAVPPPAPKVAPAPPPKVALERRPKRRRGGDPVTDSNPWPRGKKGLRLRLLQLIAGSRDPKVALGYLVARSGGFGMNIVNYTLRSMMRHGQIERSGTAKHYRYAITGVGRAALAWKA